MSRIVQRVREGRLQRSGRTSSRDEVQRCGSLGAVLGYHSVFSPSIIEAIRSDALN